jgi:hypothetical protein
MKTILGGMILVLFGGFLGAHFFAVPLRTFSVDPQGNQHCSGLRHGESFEVFCLSTQRPLGESAGRNVDRKLYPPRKRIPSAEDYRAPWQAPRPPPDRNPQGFTYHTPEEGQ